MEGPVAFDGFVMDFLRKHFPDGDAPQWVHDALLHAGIDISRSLRVSSVINTVVLRKSTDNSSSII